MNFKVQHPLIQPGPIEKQAHIHKQSTNQSFKQLFHAELANGTTLQLSKHAETRMSDRGISLSVEKWNKVENAVKNARQKGVKEALVLTNEAAFVVSTKNELIITALDRQSAGEHVFTNIDGTVVINE